MLYRKKPVVVEAVQFTEQNLEELLQFCDKIDINYQETRYIANKGVTKFMINATVNTLEGDMIASIGDYIIKGVDGEFYPCKPDIFEKTYEVAE